MKCKLNASEDDGWDSKKLNEGPLKKFMEKIGFKTDNLDSKQGSTVAQLLEGRNGFKELKDSFKRSSYSDFLNHLQRGFSSDASDRPLAALCLAAKYYLSSPPSQSFDERCRVQHWLRNLKETLNFANYQDLNSAYDAFLDEVKRVHSTHHSDPRHSCPVFSRIAIPSMTIYPRALKEAVDWVARIIGIGGWTARDKDGHDDLGPVVGALVKYDDHKRNLGIEVAAVNGLIDEIAEHVGNFIGFKKNAGFQKGYGIAKEGYFSAYSRATWSKSDAAKYAPIFLTVVPVITFSLAYLSVKCNSEWKSDHSTYSKLKAFFKVMGFDEFMLKGENSATSVAGLIGLHFPVLKEITFHYKTAVEQLKEKAVKQPSYVSHNPLAKCFVIIHLFLTNPADESTETITEVLRHLEIFMNLFRSWTDSKLEEEFNEFLKQVRAAIPGSSYISSPGHANESASNSPSAAPAIGGLLGTAAVGGAGAAVALDLGGVKTMIKSAIDILK
ncbi:variant erythrocyte surface antigen-1 family protein [Babesia caballi]|uniref:Variant erythrocyte surface antigen-1 family protein n=1 Tax=Babesia caballi TaxID=5871 RepID=A0AAV4LR90_BABCB|nr:variant erythrocyte surface antigen-1 family protein [Babesia caballi]